MKLRKTSPARRYVIARDAEGVVTCRAERADGKLRKLAHVKFHSPTGLEAGSGGRGPADLALSIAADLLQAPRIATAYRRPSGRAVDAWVLHQHLKARWIAGLKVPTGGAAVLDGAELYAWALEQRARVHAAVHGENA